MALTYNSSGNIAGFVLAGGKSSRMGKDKRYIRSGGMTLIERVDSMLERLLGRKPWIIGDNIRIPGIEPYRLLGDARPNCGPLGGLVTALETSPAPFCLILAVDMPLLTESDLAALILHMDSTRSVNSLTENGQPQPLAAIYATDTAFFWRRRLERGEFNLTKGITELGWNPITLPGTRHPLTNLNSPEDLRIIEDLE